MKKIANAIIRWQIYIGALVLIPSIVFSIGVTIAQGTFNGLSILPVLFIGFYFLIKWSAEIISREINNE
jgi:hypothetical protein